VRSQNGDHRQSAGRRCRGHDGLRRRLPRLPGKRYEDWDLPDPAGPDLEAVRLIRDDIRQRVRQLLAGLIARDDPARPADG
jgi:protein-tyrosine-phosphatase